MAEEEMINEEEVSTNDTPISDDSLADKTDLEITSGKIFTQPADVSESEITADDYMGIQETFDNNAIEREEIDDYEKKTGRKVVDYSYISDNTFNNTGTDLDGRSVREIANSKNASPNQIFEMKDLLEQVSYAGYEVWRSLSKIGFWAGTGIAEAVAGEDIELSEQEQLRANPLDYGNSPEARTYVGAFAKPVTQLAAGVGLVKAAGAVTGAAKGAEYIKGLAKNAYGKKVLTGTFNLIKGMATDVVSFDENQQNFAEMLKSFGVDTPELLQKNPEDSFFAKKLKNSVDGAVFQMTLGALVGSAKMFAKGGKSLLARGAKPIEEIAQSADDVQKAVAAGTRIEPSKEVMQAGEQTTRIATQTPEEIAKTMGDASKEVLEQAKSVVSPEMIDEATKTVKGLSQKEKERIIKKVVAELSDDQSDVVAEKIARSDLKKLNKEQFENVVYNKQKEIIDQQKITKEAQDFSTQLSAGNKNDKELASFVKERLTKLLNNRKSVIESVSGAAQSVAELSTSMTRRRMNKMISYIEMNADRLDNKQLLDLMAEMDNPEAFDRFFKIAGDAIKKGKIEEMFDKLTYLRQNIMLSSSAAWIKDFTSTIGHRVLEWGDVATAAAVKQSIVKPFRAIKKSFTKADEVSARTRLGMGDVDDVELREIYDNVSGMGSFLTDWIKFKYQKMTKTLDANAINPVTKHMDQVGKSLSKYNLKKNIQMDVVPGDNYFSNLLNKVINHSGIYASEAKDDILTAMFHNADVKQNVGRMVRRLVKSGEISEADAPKAIEKYLTMADNWSKEAGEKAIDFADGLTDAMRMNSIMKRSAESASKTTFRDPLTGAVKGIYNTINKYPFVRIPLKLIAPFQKTGLTVALERGLKERSAFTLINPEFWSKVMAGGREGQLATARLINGLATQSAVAYAMYNHQIMGPMPKNKGERELLQSAGVMEYSVKVGDKYYSLTDVAGPLGPLIRSSLDVTDYVVRTAIEQEEMGDVDDQRFINAVLSGASVFGTSPFSTTVFGGILENAERGDVWNLKNMIKSFATGPRFINEGWSGISRLQDFLGTDTNIGADTRYKKAPYDMLEQLTTSLGGEGHYRRDLFGDRMLASEMSWVGLMSSQESSDTVTREMIEKKAFVSPPSNVLRIDSVSVPLTDEEKDLWFDELESLHPWAEMDKFIKSSQYKRLPDVPFDSRGKHQKNKTDELQRKYSELVNKAAKNLIDKDSVIKLKYLQQKSTIPTINLQPYAEMIGE